MIRRPRATRATRCTWTRAPWSSPRPMRVSTARRLLRRHRHGSSPDAGGGAIIMKFLPLIWASLFRRRTRTILTLLSVVTAFVLFGLLDAVRLSFSQAGQSANGAQRLQTGAKLSFIDTLPMSLGAQIE